MSTPVTLEQVTRPTGRTGILRARTAFSLFQLGIATWMNSLWLVLTLLVPVGIMSLVVIPREERYLEARFPSEYSDYKASVRRWL